MDEVPDLMDAAPELDYMADDSDSGDDGWEECVDDSESPASCLCLFCVESAPSPEACFEHCFRQHQFSIHQLHRQLQLDCFSYIKMINYIRKTNPAPSSLEKLSPTEPLPWDSDNFMKPVLEDDGMLQFDPEDLCMDPDGPTSPSAKCEPSPISQPQELCAIAPEGLSPEICAAAAGQHRLLQRVREVETRATQAEDRLQQALTDLDRMRLVAKDLVMTQGPELPPSDRAIQNLRDGEDDAYFDSYCHFSIHQDMLQDKVRTESYRDAICGNTSVFQDKVVLDVGCGTGILSLLAARAGAKLVIGVEMSDIIYQAMDIVRENGFQDKIKLIKGRMEDVDLPVDKVDIIISEWMGYLLLFESMLDTVLWARDRYLREGGLVFPDKSDIFLAAVDDVDMHRKNYTYWDDVYGFKMTCMKKAVLSEANVTVVDSEKLITEPCVIKEIDICRCQTKDLEFSSPFKLHVQRTGNITALLAYFDVFFNKGSNKVWFSTGPKHTPTHWKQAVFLVDIPLAVQQGDVIDGQFSCKKNRKDPRSLIVTIHFKDRTFAYLMQ